MATRAAVSSSTDDALVVPQRLRRRQQLGRVGGSGLGLGERADGRAAQVAQVGPAAEQVPEVGGERADVRPRGALDLDAVDERVRPSVRPRSGATVTGRASRSTSMPSRASSCRRRPPTCRAETIGGTWTIVPVRWSATAARTASSVTSPMSWRAVTSPDGVEGRRLDAEHDLAGVGLGQVGQEAQQPGHASRRRRAARPVASGSSVPECPMRRSPRRRRSWADDVVARHSGRLVDDEQPVDGQGPTPGQGRPPPTPPASAVAVAWRRPAGSARCARRGG